MTMKKLVALTVAALGVMSFTVFAQGTTVTTLSTGDRVGVEALQPKVEDEARGNCRQSNCDTYNECGQGDDCLNGGVNAEGGNSQGGGCCN